MPFCASCGANVEGKFCPKCGAAAGAAASGAFVPPPPPSQTIDASGIPANVASVLCYVIQVICPILFLVLDPYKTNRKIRFDAFQSLFLTGGFIVIKILQGILSDIIWRVSFLSPLISLAELILIVFLAVKAFQNQKVVLPIIGPLAEKQA